jgi:hypothetical protein
MAKGYRMLNKFKEVQKKIDNVVDDINDLYDNDLELFFNSLEIGDKDLYKTLLSRMHGILLLSLYKNIECSESRGLNITINKNTSTSKAISINSNGKESCKILMYNGMNKYSDKKEELETRTYIN